MLSNSGDSFCMEGAQVVTKATTASIARLTDTTVVEVRVLGVTVFAVASEFSILQNCRGRRWTGRISLLYSYVARLQFLARGTANLELATVRQ